MRMLIAGFTLLLALTACQRRGAAAGANMETGAKGADSMATQPQAQPPAQAPTTLDTTKKGGANPADSTHKP
jgi:hypothetical protein